VRAALDGRQILTAELYDGSEKGRKVSPTTAIIGKRLAPGADATLVRVPAAAALAKVPSWPVSIGFFDPNSERRDAVPSAEQSYLFYANGVSTQLVTDFGDYTLRFELRDLTFLEQSPCRDAGP
jgi:hypothetical protein